MIDSCFWNVLAKCTTSVWQFSGKQCVALLIFFPFFFFSFSSLLFRIQKTQMRTINQGTLRFFLYFFFLSLKKDTMNERSQMDRIYFFFAFCCVKRDANTELNWFSFLTIWRKKKVKKYFFAINFVRFLRIGKI